MSWKCVLMGMMSLCLGQYLSPAAVHEVEVVIVAGEHAARQPGDLWNLRALMVLSHHGHHLGTPRQVLIEGRPVCSWG